ncbi:MAG: chemotaxis protein CheW [Alphaproteobacteria bacterium]|nr:chemotaxis protein CheW [Alphaproteobacteria bacterium]
MDDLLREFLTETSENLDVVDLELVKLERDPNNKDVLDKIFRLVHTVKGTCGFLGLPRLERVAHVSETLLGKYRDGQLTVTPSGITLVLSSLDRIKAILKDLEANESEPAGDDGELISQLEAAATGAEVAVARASAMPGKVAEPAAQKAEESQEASQDVDLPPQDLGRPLKPGEVSLDELEQAFRSAGAQPMNDAAAHAATPDTASAQPRGDAAKGEGSVAQQSIRVNVDVLEDLMTMVSELVLTRNQLLEMVRRLDNSEFKVPLQRLSNVTAELQEGVMKTRMQPIGNAWQKLPRIVRDLAHELSKKINLEMIGSETELDRQVLELIKDPLTHMVRNSADHGLELPAVRRASGKSETGTITLKAYHEGGHIIVEVGDDGRGLDIARIKTKALERGIVSEAELQRMSDAQIAKFIFAAGFSTAAKVTNVSGRGVGMDVVRTNIELIGGTIDLVSKQGQGSTFIIKIPLTLAIVSALIVETAGQRFAIPQSAVLELVRARPGSEQRIESINATPVLRLRNRLLPLVYLSDVLGLESEKAKTDEAYVIVSRVAGQTFGIIVDTVYDTQEIVVKPSASLLRDIEMFSGNTILGDGSVIMIIDPNGIARAVAHDAAGDQKGEEVQGHASALRRDETTAMLIFRAGSQEPKAVPLSLVTRLEDIEVNRIETSNGRILVQYRGRLMPLVFVSPSQNLKSEGRQPILVFTDEDRAMGLVVDEIVDIVDDRLKIELSGENPSLLGSAIIKGKATEIIDAAHYLTLAYDDWFVRHSDHQTRNAPKRILLVDDSAFFRNMITPLLESAGYEVVATDGAENAFKLRDEGVPIDCIVSDLEMPGTDGFAFAMAVKSDENWRELPLVALSSLQSAQDVERTRDAGFDTFVNKTERHRLVSVISDALNRGAAAA